ncbi:riboflavin biosynthesis protein RibD [Dictyobacter aurantiacus]|uniref:Riboflavin biosynthesis protein RibD n=2 Tax=Dictyobacter aurantiacus TaxID=1936993 RepID=A0A401ZKE7_9CHLR|nr:riboflavin biosynthesis protein RibD [Dictyobacter aurantiacus]
MHIKVNGKGYHIMRKIIEYTLVSVDGVFAGAATAGFAEYRDDAYMQDGLSQALACDILLMGRTTYEDFAKIWTRRTDPWAERINAMPKYVFSSTLEQAAWNNTTIVRGDVVAEVTRLKQQEGRDLLLYGHGLLAETLLKHHLVDVLDLSIYPFVAGQGRPFFREGENTALRFVAAKSFSNGIVKITYEPRS